MFLCHAQFCIIIPAVNEDGENKGSDEGLNSRRKQRWRDGEKTFASVRTVGGRGVISKGALPMKSQSGLSVWIHLRNSQRQSDEMKNPVRSFTQLLRWSLLFRTGENRQLFRSVKMIPGSGFLTTPAPLLTASDFRQTKRPAYHTQIAQYTGHSGYSLRHWYS